MGSSHRGLPGSAEFAAVAVISSSYSGSWPSQRPARAMPSYRTNPVGSRVRTKAIEHWAGGEGAGAGDPSVDLKTRRGRYGRTPSTCVILSTCPGVSL